MTTENPTVAGEATVEHKHSMMLNIRRQPWGWIYLALNPLFIINQIHTVDFYIKAVWIALVMAVTFLFVRTEQDNKKPISFNWFELLFVGYMVWGTIGLIWSVNPVLGFERIVYMLYGVGAYIIGKQSRFWESTLFWNVFAGTAGLVGLVGILMYLFYNGGGGGFKSFIGFDWIMSAGRPSSTLSYRAYAGTYMVVTMPFLLWFMFSDHIKSVRHSVFASGCFVLLMTFMIYSRARSGWIGIALSLFVFILLLAIREYKVAQSEHKSKQKSWLIGSWLLSLVVAIGMAFVTSANEAEWFRGLDSGWYMATVVGAAVGIGVGTVLTTIVFLMQKAQNNPNRKYLMASGVVSIAIIGLLSQANMSPGIIGSKANPQAISGTNKETVSGTVEASFKMLAVGRSDRLDFWRMSKDMLFEKSVRGKYENITGLPHFWTGVGIQQFPIHVPMHSEILHSLGAEIHNDWVQAFVETGVFGGLCWVGFAVALALYSWKRRDDALMLACLACIVGWWGSTQTDFLTARIYGLIWLGAVAAMINGIAEPKKVVTLPFLSREMLAKVGGVAIVICIFVPYILPAYEAIGRTPMVIGLMLIASIIAFVFVGTTAISTGRKVGVVFFLLLAAGYSITAWCDRQIFRSLVDKKPPVNELTELIFPYDTFPSYRYGIGKYLIFSPITDLSRAISTQLQNMQQNGQYSPEHMRMQTAQFDGVQEALANEILYMHPYNYNAMALLVDMRWRQKDYDAALEINSKYLELRPMDLQMRLFKAQVLLDQGGEENQLKAAREIALVGKLSQDVLEEYTAVPEEHALLKDANRFMRTGAQFAAQRIPKEVSEIINAELEDENSELMQTYNHIASLPEKNFNVIKLKRLNQYLLENEASQEDVEEEQAEL